MIANTHREALSVLEDLCDLCPDVRLGQLFANLGFLSEDETGRSLWNVEDDELLAVMRNHLADLKKRDPQSTVPGDAA